MIYPIIIVFIIVFIKAIFSATDTAFTYLNKAEIKQLSKKDKKAQKIRVLMDDFNKFFGIIEVGINMCELLASAVVSITILESLIDVFESNGLSIQTSSIMSVAIVTVILSYVMLVFGGVLPKRIARNNPKKIAFKLIPVLWIVAKLNYPFERIIYFSNKLLSKIFNIPQEPQEKITEKQLKMIIKEAKEEGLVGTKEKQILMNTIKADPISVKKIMIPMDKIYCININDDLSKILRQIKKNKYTRIPVYKTKKTKIIGVFNIKDVIIEYTEQGLKDKEQIKSLIKEPIFIKSNEKIFSAFKILQKNSNILGIVIDDNNTPIGIITLEDIIEKLVGKIFDEDDKKI